MDNFSRFTTDIMQPDITYAKLALQHIIVIVIFAILSLFGLAIYSGIPYWPAFVACLIFCGFVAAYGLYFAPLLGQQKVNVDHTLREQAKLADGFAEAMVIIDETQNILYANPAARSLFKLAESEDALEEFLQTTSIASLVNITLAGGHSEPVTIHRQSPAEQHIRVTASGIQSSPNSTKEQSRNPAHLTKKIRRAIIVFYDITDLVRVDTMRADFLANASHELKTPVASLLGYIETLQGHAKDDPEAQEMFLGIMQQQAERMQRLINDLLSLRRIEIAEHLSPVETADLYLATRAAIESVKPLAKKRNIHITYNGPKQALVTGIQDELVQLVLNILDNAMLVTASDASIDLTLEIKDDWNSTSVFSTHPEFSEAPRREIVSPSAPLSRFAVLRLRDYGPGFAPEHLPRIGERFYKIMGQRNSKKHGTGLGLAIVKHIMRRHRGGLFIESAENVGTIFTILLPLPPIK